MDDRSDIVIDMIVALGLVALCVLALAESLTIPSTAFDALGSARIPQAAAIIVGVLSLAVFCRGLMRLHGLPRAAAPEPGARRRRIDALAMLVLSALFVWAMQRELTGFGVLATVYLVLAMTLLDGFHLKRLPVIVALSALVGFGCAYVFTKIFIVNLPGL